MFDQNWLKRYMLANRPKDDDDFGSDRHSGQNGSGYMGPPVKGTISSTASGTMVPSPNNGRPRGKGFAPPENDAAPPGSPHPTGNTMAPYGERSPNLSKPRTRGLVHSENDAAVPPGSPLGAGNMPQLPYGDRSPNSGKPRTRGVLLGQHNDVAPSGPPTPGGASHHGKPRTRGLVLGDAEKEMAQAPIMPYSGMSNPMAYSASPGPGPAPYPMSTYSASPGTSPAAFEAAAERAEGDGYRTPDHETESAMALRMNAPKGSGRSVGEHAEGWLEASADARGVAALQTLPQQPGLQSPQQSMVRPNQQPPPQQQQQRPPYGGPVVPWSQAGPGMPGPPQAGPGMPGPPQAAPLPGTMWPGTMGGGFFNPAGPVPLDDRTNLMGSASWGYGCTGGLKNYVVMCKDDVEVRASPTYADDARIGHFLHPGQVVVVDDRRMVDGSWFLRLADGRGWAFETKERLLVMTQAHDFERGLWHYTVVVDDDVETRGVPTYSDDARTGSCISPGDCVAVDERCRVAGVLFLKLADGRGWVFETKDRLLVMSEVRAKPHEARDFERGLWHYTVVCEDDVEIRAASTYSDEARTGLKIHPGDCVAVDERCRVAGVWFLRLADGRGWVFETKDTRQVMIQMH